MIIVIINPRHSFDTSLICTIYEQFLQVNKSCSDFLRSVKGLNKYNRFVWDFSQG